MTALLLAAGMALAAGGALAALGPLNRRALAGLMQRNRARWVAVCLAGAVVLVCCGLAFLTVPAMLQVLPGVARAWPRLGAGVAPGATGVGWLAALLLLSSACAAAARARMSQRERRVLRVERDVGKREHRSGFDVVTLPGTALVAYSLGGRRPQIVLSQGLRDAVGGAGIAAVVAHEAAHLRARHDRWLQLASLAEAALWFVPWVRPAAGALRLSLERWADEDAAREVGRDALRAALLAAAGIEPVPSWAAALSGADALAERLALLAAGPQAGSGRRRLRVLDVGSLAAMAAAAAGGAGGLGVALGVLQHLCAA